MLGSIVSETTLSFTDNLVDISKLSKGIYMVSIISENFTKNCMLFKN